MKLHPYQVQPLNEIVNQKVRKIVLCSAAQMLKTSLMTASMCYLMANDSANMAYASEQPYDIVYGNPPFGKIKTSEAITGAYRGAEFEYKVITHGASLAPYGVWIVPQGSAGFVYSGARCYERQESTKYQKFTEQTGLHFEAGCGIDTSIYRDQWHGTNVVCEVVTVEYM